MPSIVSGYEYDVFISYRQNDNRSGWVTDFVKHLNEELAAAIKEPVSVYFDSNVHDGLLDTHNVKKSLEQKLNCLVFIPILSQTYCDPKSFAWQNEFCAFNLLAQDDKLGMDIVLKTGNVSSRILPVKIHDLDATDRKIIEKETGDLLRSIDFIFRSAGVNRPLLAHEDHPHDNQNRTYYRDQINKVALAIKDLIKAMEHPVIEDEEETSTAHAEQSNLWRKVMKVSFLFVFVFAGYYAYQKVVAFKNPAASKSSIAIIPFRNNTGDETKNYYGVGIASEVSTQLGLAKQFDFITSLQATIQYQQTNDSPVKISNELGVTHLLTGMYQTAGDHIQVAVELIDAATSKVIWSLTYRTKYNDVLELQTNIATRVLQKFSATSTVQNANPTQNLEAYFHYMKGMETIMKSHDIKERLKAIPEFKMAIRLDSGFVAAWSEMVGVYSFYYFNAPKNDTTVAPGLIQRHVEFMQKRFPDSWETKRSQGLYQYYVLTNYEKALGLFTEVLQQNPEAVTPIGSIYRRKLKFDLAIKYDSKVVQQFPNRTGAWNVLVTDFLMNGNMADAGKAADTVYRLNHHETALYYLKFRQRKLKELPEEMKRSFGKVYLADLLMQNQNYQALLNWIDTVRLDSALRLRNKYLYAAIAHHMLRHEDSSKIFANRFLQSPRETNRFTGADFLEVTILGLLHREAEAQSIIDSGRQSETEDLNTQWSRKMTKIRYYALSKEYQKATVLLQEINRDYPQIGFYDWLDYYFFDRIKKDYRPFQEAINNLKYPPKITATERLKW